MGESGQRTRLIATPVFAGSVGLLLLNDRVLKAAWPGWVTGKLSDVAGVAMVAIGLTALIRVRNVAFGLTIAAFTALKVVPPVAVAAAPILGGVTRTDPTDLIALLVLWPVGGWMARSAPRATERAHGGAVPLNGGRFIVQTALVAAAVFATSATSGDCGPTGLWFVQAVDGVAYARSDLDVWTSADGGVTWQTSDLAWNDSRFANGRDTESCVGDRCFDIVRSTSDSSFRVVESLDGVSTDVLVFGLEQRRGFGEAIRPTCGDESGAHLAAVDVAGGVHVVLAMGEAGTLHRSPDSVWEWVAVGPWGVERSAVSGDTFLDHPIATRPDRSPFATPWVARSLLWAAPIIAFGAALPLAAIAGRRGRSRVAAILLSALVGLVVLAPSLLLIGLLDNAPHRSAGSYSIAGGVLVLIAVVGVGSLFAWFARDARPLRPDPGWTSRASTSGTPPWPPPPPPSGAPSTPPIDELVE